MVISGPYLVRFINLATSEGIYLWDLRRPSKDYLVVKVGIEGFFACRHLLRKTKSHARIRERRGLPFYWQKLLQRRLWLLGMVMTFGALLFISQLILFIRIEGVDDPHGALRRELLTYGVTVGANRGKIEKKIEFIEEELKIAHPDFLWVDLSLKGVLFQIKVVPRKVPPLLIGPVDLIAKKAGRIERLTVVRGTPLVQEGHTVAAGDLLIAGYQVIKEMDGSLLWKEVSAKGQVEAVIGYEIVILEPLSIWECRTAPGKRTAVSLRWRNRIYPLMAWGRIPKTSYREVYRKQLGNGRNPWNLVEVFIDTIQEVQWEKSHITFADAMAKARKEASSRLKRTIPGTMLIHRTWEDWTIEGNVLHYRQVMEVVEDITLPRPREKE